jgi:hypothetical protein
MIPGSHRSRVGASFFYRAAVHIPLKPCLGVQLWAVLQGPIAHNPYFGAENCQLPHCKLASPLNSLV